MQTGRAIKKRRSWSGWGSEPGSSRVGAQYANHYSDYIMPHPWSSNIEMIFKWLLEQFREREKEGCISIVKNIQNFKMGVQIKCHAKNICLGKVKGERLT